ncbi:MAG: hypothetical protein U9Q96_01865 [Patescibacteria group bacterium]|nr:hypothetical protein [Patescibacteria group bacterium]
MAKKSLKPKNLSKILLTSFLIFLTIVILFTFLLFLLPKLNSSVDDWSIVYLSTGEIYIGKLSSFPSLKLTKAYILQVITTEASEQEGESQTNFQLTPLTDALWAPKELYLNKDQIVFYGPIEETSRVVETLRRGVIE